jgi:hypothetical protein
MKICLLISKGPPDGLENQPAQRRQDVEIRIRHGNIPHDLQANETLKCGHDRCGLMRTADFRGVLKSAQFPASGYR